MWCENTLMAYKKIDSHFPSTFGQVIQILDQLCKLWEKKLCHGDVRLANMIFGENSQLIDFDYCGVEGEREYPSGYASDLVDTKRHPDAKPESLLHRCHDWFSFQFILRNLSSTNQKPEEEFEQILNFLLKSSWEDVLKFMKQSNLSNQMHIPVQLKFNITPQRHSRNTDSDQPPSKRARLQ